jgi:hypothetical protein
MTANMKFSVPEIDLNGDEARVTWAMQIGRSLRTGCR